EKALSFINETPPDIIISDLMLDQTNLNLELSKLIKSDKLKCPLIVVSAMEPEKIKKVSDIFFQKPCEIKNLKDKIYQLLGKNEYEQPNLEHIYRNYDFDNTKIAKVLELLTNEFVAYQRRID